MEGAESSGGPKRGQRVALTKAQQATAAGSQLVTLVLIILFVGASITIAGCTPKPRNISGQVFIQTKGAGNVTLDLVEVRAFDEAVIRPHVDSVAAKIAAIQKTDQPVMLAAVAKYNAHNEEVGKTLRSGRSLADGEAEALNAEESLALKLKDELEKKTGPDLYFENLPSATLGASTTDADGRFRISIPAGKHVALVAKGSRSVGKETERYYWIVRVDWPATGEAECLLSNHNLSSSLNAHSLIFSIER